MSLASSYFFARSDGCRTFSSRSLTCLSRLFARSEVLRRTVFENAGSRGRSSAGRNFGDSFFPLTLLVQGLNCFLRRGKGTEELAFFDLLSAFANLLLNSGVFLRALVGNR